MVTRRKRESDDAGNNPCEYSAISLSALLNTIIGDIQSELNTVFTLDGHISDETTLESSNEPVTISVEDRDTTTDTGASEDAGDEADDTQDGDDTDM